MSLYLVTGGCGFIGSHSVDALIELGHNVVVLDNLSSGKLSNRDYASKLAHKKGLLLDFVQGNINDYGLLSQVFDEYEYDGVLHLAALTSVPDSFKNVDLYYETNFSATMELVWLSVWKNVSRFVFASSAAVYAGLSTRKSLSERVTKPLSPYGHFKLAAESGVSGYASAFNLEAISLRYFNVYGSRQNPSSAYSGVISIFQDCYKNNKPITVYGDGLQVRDFVYVKDVAKYNVEALLKPELKSDVYNVCTGIQTSLLDVLDLFHHLYGNEPHITFTDPRIGDTTFSLGQPQKLCDAFGTYPDTSFREGLTKEVSNGW